VGGVPMLGAYGILVLPPWLAHVLLLLLLLIEE
jgi:hypothetical protein